MNKQLPECYWVWSNMIQRCTNPKSPAWRNYGGRGIEVCERWCNLDGRGGRHSRGYGAGFLNFMADMGPRPTKKHTLERRNNDGRYEPANCYWATRKEQSANKRDNVRVVYQGRSWLAIELAAHVGMPYVTLAWRLRQGWGVKRAVDTPCTGRPQARRIEYQGRNWTFRELSEYCGIGQTALERRIRQGWPIERAVTQVQRPRTKSKVDSP